MKLIFASIGLASLAQAQLSDRRFIHAPIRPYHQSQLLRNLEQKFDQHFIKHDDGFEIDFSPYFNMEVMQEGTSGNIVACLPTEQGLNCNPQNKIRQSWNILQQPDAFIIDVNTEGNVRNSLGQLLTNINPLQEVDDFSSKMHVMCQWSITGIKLSKKLDADWTWTDGSPRAQISAEHYLTTKVKLEGPKFTVNVDSTGDCAVSNIRRPGKMMFAPLLEPMSFRAGLELVLNDVNYCNNWIVNPSEAINANVKCEIDVSSNVEHGETPLSRKPVADMKVMIGMRPYVVILKAAINNDPSNYRTVNKPFMLFFRAENDQGKTERLNTGNYYGFYATRSNNWQHALKEASTELIIRFPGSKTYEDILLPRVQFKWKPWDKLIDTLSTNDVRTHLYLYFNIDQFLKTFEDEFDCSELVKASRVESTLSRHAISAINNEYRQSFPLKLNDFLSESCEMINEEVIEAIHHPQIGNVMHEVRKVVKDVASNNGGIMYQQLFGTIFE